MTNASEWVNRTSVVVDTFLPAWASWSWALEPLYRWLLHRHARRELTTDHRQARSRGVSFFLSRAPLIIFTSHACRCRHSNNLSLQHKFQLFILLEILPFPDLSYSIPILFNSSARYTIHTHGHENIVQMLRNSDFRPPYNFLELSRGVIWSEYFKTCHPEDSRGNWVEPTTSQTSAQDCDWWYVWGLWWRLSLLCWTNPAPSSSSSRSSSSSSSPPWPWHQAPGVHQTRNANSQAPKNHLVQCNLLPDGNRMYYIASEG